MSLLGRTGIGLLDAGDRTFAFLASAGFVLVMFVAGTHVPVRDPRLRGALRVGALRAVAVGVLAVPAAFGIARLFHTGHPGLYAVLLASSSAALVLPIVDSLHLDGEPILQLLPQVAIADTACIVALPLAIDPGHAGRAALGALAVIAGSPCLSAFCGTWSAPACAAAFTGCRRIGSSPSNFGSTWPSCSRSRRSPSVTHVSVMLAGFGYGLAVAAVGEPRRLARQLFAVTEGFLGPLFFVWLGASLDIRALGLSYTALGVLLGLGAVLVHIAMRVSGQPIPVGGLAAAQLGVPVAAATVGTQLHVLAPGEAAALIVGALVTIAVAVLAGARSVVATTSPK